MENKQCPNCKEQYNPNHGNRIYCSKDCYEKFKRSKQAENNNLMKKCRLGFLKNYRTFLELLPEAGTTSMPILKLLKNGFDQDAFYGTVIDKKGLHWYKVNEYLFNISQINNQSIFNLYKS